MGQLWNWRCDVAFVLEADKTETKKESVHDNSNNLESVLLKEVSPLTF